MLSFFPPTWIVQGEPSDLGYNAQNSHFWIRLASKAPSPAAVWCQERYEWGFKWFWGFLMSSPALAYAGWMASQSRLVEAALACLVAFAVTLHGPRFINRRMEIEGHAIEIEACVDLYGELYENALTREARALTGYDQFKGWDTNRCMSALIAKKKWAEIEYHGMRKSAIKMKAKIDARIAKETANG